MWRALGDGAPEGPRAGALITGAAGGLGAAFASALAERGWALTLVDLDPDRLRSLTDRLRADGTSVDGCVIDLAADPRCGACCGASTSGTR
jgi:short-subunit dehydrogenase